MEILDSQRVPVNETERERRIVGKPPELLYPYYGATRQQGWIDGFLFDGEYVLLGEDGVPFFDANRSKAYVVSGRTWVNNHAHVLRGKGVSNRFLCHALNVADYVGRATGTTRLKLTQGKMMGIPIPVPPPEEQERIVACVDELMSLCDGLEQAEQVEQAAATRFTAASIGALVNAASAEEFTAAWGRLIQNLSEVIDGPEKVPALREAILDAAVRGRLVPQLSHEGTADGLLAQLAEGARNLAKRKVARTNVQIQDVGADEIPYSVPRTWRWVRMAHMGGFLGGGTPSKANSQFWDGDVPWVSPKDMKRPYIEDAEDHISDSALSASAAKVIPAPGLLFVVRGMILAHSFPVALTRRDVTINQDMRALVLAVPETAEWMLRVAQSLRRRVLSSVERSSHGTCRLDASVVEMQPVPMPPLAEQARIVEKLREMMALCDDLEAKLRERNERAIGLSGALAASFSR